LRAASRGGGPLDTRIQAQVAPHSAPQVPVLIDGTTKSGVRFRFWSIRENFRAPVPAIRGRRTPHRRGRDERGFGALRPACR